jgi:hypothetical protein
MASFSHETRHIIECRVRVTIERSLVIGRGFTTITRLERRWGHRRCEYRERVVRIGRGFIIIEASDSVGIGRGFTTITRLERRWGRRRREYRARVVRIGRGFIMTNASAGVGIGRGYTSMIQLGRR